MKIRRRISMVMMMILIAVSAATALAGPADIVVQSGIRGGIIVHLDCNDGRETARMLVSENVTVQGLDTDGADIDIARKYLSLKGCYGRVTAVQFDGKTLPYADNLINMIVSEGKTGVPEKEILRVLRPLGFAYINGKKIVKPWPKEIDDWGHFLHAPDNNAVAADELAGLPRTLQWVDGEKWARSHEEFSSVSMAVSARGRIFYIADESPTAYISFNPEWKIIARDAFNGKLLWKRPIQKWNDHMRHFRTGPAHFQRRMVAVGDRVYVTLGLDAPLSELDAVTGKTLKEYKDSEWAEEILAHDGVLYLLIGSSETNRFGGGLFEKGEPSFRKERFITAINADSGKVLWRANAGGEDFVMPQGMALSNGRLFVHYIKGLACLEPETGKRLWFVERPSAELRNAYSTSTLVATPEVVLLADRDTAHEQNKPAGIATEGVRWLVQGWTEKEYKGKLPRFGAAKLTAYQAADGKTLWEVPCLEGYNSPVDVFVVDGIVWVGPYNRKQKKKDGYDLMTGKVRKTIDLSAPPVGMPHHRCYRNKASLNYVFTSNDGVELIDHEKGWVRNNSWTRGPCQLGIMPCNGMLYMPTDPCACHLKSRLPGFKAYSPYRPASVGKPITARGRLTRGPAYGRIAPSLRDENDNANWPMYRHDISRSGATSQNVSIKEKPDWTTLIGGRLTQPVAANGRVYVAAPDKCAVIALDISSGNIVWQYMAGGVVDSSPTAYGNTILFGSADGYVHCLDAATGDLAWKFMAAPEQRLISVYGRIASSWPVHGSVLVKNGEVYFTAGSSSYLGGGIYFYRLNASTGELVSSNVISHIDPVTEKQTVEKETKFDSVGVFTDILSSDGEALFLKHIQLDDRGVEQPAARTHLFSPTSLLDREWFVRTYWVYGVDILGAGYGGWTSTAKINPSGRILSIDADTAYGYGRVNLVAAAVGHRNNVYHLFASEKTYEYGNEPGPDGKKKKFNPRKYKKTFIWSQPEPFTVRAMVATPGALFVAGVPDTGRRPEETANDKRLRFENPDEALAAFKGERGAFLRVVSKDDGTTKREIRLDDVPVFDGMSAAGGRLFLSMKNGSVCSFGGPDSKN